MSRGSGRNDGSHPGGNVKEWADAADAQNEKRGDTQDNEFSEKNGDFTDTRQDKQREGSAVSGPFNGTGPAGGKNASRLGGIDERLNTGISNTSTVKGNGGLAPLNTNLNNNGTARGTSPGRTTFVDQVPPSAGGAGANGNSPHPLIANPLASPAGGPFSPGAGAQFGSTKTRRRRGTTRSRKGLDTWKASDDVLTREEAESLLELVQGSLVCFPYDWLKQVEENSNWLYQVDQVAPLQIYD